MVHDRMPIAGDTPMDHDFIPDFTSRRKRQVREYAGPSLKASRRRMLAVQFAMSGEKSEHIVERIRELGWEDYDDVKLSQDLTAVKTTWRNAAVLAHTERVELEDKKLDLLEQYAWERIQYGGSENPIAEILAIASRRARLNGLDKPKRIHLGNDADSPLRSLSDEELERMILAEQGANPDGATKG